MKIFRAAIVVGVAAASMLAGCSQEPEPAPVATPRPTALVDAARMTAPADGEWLSYGRTYDEQRFSPLTQVDAGNVAQLGLAWSYDLDTAHRVQESTPLVIDGVMYVTSAWSKLFALDARTGQEIWRFDPKVPGEVAVKACCDVGNRGVAAWKGRIYLGTLDGRLLAIDAATGKQLWEVMTVPQGQNYTITGAPRVFDGKVLIGNGGAELGARGYVTAYDAEDGKQLWRFYTVPGDPAKGFESPALEKAARTWKGEWWKFGGGGTVWDSIVYDPKLGLIYIGVGNGSPWNQAVRSPGGGDNLYLSSIVALRADTGEYVWHFQTTPGETWDYTATQPIILADLEIGGKPRQVLMQAPKNGFFYVIDRTNGEFISGAAYAFVNWTKGLDPKTGRPSEVKDARYDRSGKPAVVVPGPGGAHNWHPMSFSPQTKLAYFPVIEAGFAFIPAAKMKVNTIGWNTGVDFNAGSLPTDPQVLAGIKSQLKGHLVAWDPVAQKEVWRAQFDHPWNGGALSTAGNLVFEGNSNGEFAAYRANDGQKLWSAETQAGVMAGPMSYAIDGEQYVAIEVGWGGAFGLAAGELARDSHLSANIPRVLVYKLGGTAKLPDLPATAASASEPPAEIGNEAVWNAGKAVFHTNCSVCHGDSAVSGGVLPDLRLSPVTRDAAAWDRIVRGGERGSRGMVSFAAEVSADDSEKVRAYVIHRANEVYKIEHSAPPAPPAPVPSPPPAAPK
ncbi:MAG TPA: PQQ-dependent dehydrogenase, methanol/ethanol family [Steroidobacteraceae bacterium]|nr:PQQ-dependent dehydrogenase, methanol/ethanol family [Steroidobacteraceae bacterium]